MTCSSFAFQGIGLGVVLASSAMLTIAVVPLATQSRQECPPIIASLLPKNAYRPSGMFNLAGPMGQGTGAAELPFEHPCVRDNKYPARIGIQFTYYGPAMAGLLKMQGEAGDQQAIQNANRELKSGAGRNPLKTEVLGTGRIVYYEYTSDCPADGPKGPPIPNVGLKGHLRTDNVLLEITLNGIISTELAKAAVAEVFGNVGKASFGKAQ